MPTGWLLPLVYFRRSGLHEFSRTAYSVITPWRKPGDYFFSFSESAFRAPPRISVIE